MFIKAENRAENWSLDMPESSVYPASIYSIYWISD